MRVKRPKPSDIGKLQNPAANGAARVRVTSMGVHAFDTEARSLEQACEIVAHYQQLAKKARTRASHPPSLRQEFGWAKNRSRLLKSRGKISLAPVGGVTHSSVERLFERPKRQPHPLKDLPEDGKRSKAQEMYKTGAWGVMLPACRRLARAFDVPLGAMVTWIDELSQC